ncbi:DEAD/DEAH box helicase family protein [Listeria monocytogenes]|nr:DEAD/DEAH box helicase family protein [Listeria monocytogenes]MCH5042730.1 DEAD/DEAH box helicase family protein [Listeria monocytogenes]MCH5048630.1 DEAD/DEAH box helicase family protein [Listeria monocytogenes]HEM0520279.1 DEAD/DEAH box helicase family protein [Listeria monocytogenes]
MEVKRKLSSGSETNGNSSARQDQPVLRETRDERKLTDRDGTISESEASEIASDASRGDHSEPTIVEEVKESERSGSFFMPVSERGEQVDLFAEETKHMEDPTLPYLEDHEEETVENFRFADTFTFPSGPKAKFQANIAAIRLLHRLETENRFANSEERNILAQYSGWGGLADAFDENKLAFQKEYLELKELLTPEEYQAAFEGTLTTYYTEPALIDRMYQVLQGLNVEPEKILEPSMGIGHFFGRLPKAYQTASLTGVEIDKLSGRIAKKLYPKAAIQLKGFEEMNSQSNTFDIAIGNIPFNDFNVTDKSKRYPHKLIHDYFFEKSLDLVKPGGYILFVTSKGTMDKKDSRARHYLAQRADLISAVRLPNTAFSGLGGTKATTDILLLQKLEKERSVVEDIPEWVQTTGFHDSQGRINTYFYNHPEKVLGELKLSGMYGGQKVIECVPKANQDWLVELDKWAVSMKTGSSNTRTIPKKVETVEASEEIIEELTEMDWQEGDEIPGHVRNDTFFVHQDKVYYHHNGRAETVEVSKGMQDRIKKMCQVRQALINIIDLQLRPSYQAAELEKRLSVLNQVYDTFTEKYGFFHDTSNQRAFFDDDQLALLESIEIQEKPGVYAKGRIFREATIRPIIEVERVQSAEEALQLSLSKKLIIDFEYMQQISGKTQEILLKELDGLLYEDPTYHGDQPNKGWLYRDDYLSGDIVEKLALAKSREESNYQKNIEALKKVMPKPLQAKDIQFQLGSTWIPIDIYERFMYQTFGTPSYYQFGTNPDIKLEYARYNNTWHIKGKGLDKGSIKASSVYGTKRMSAYEILECSLNLQQVIIRDPEEYYDENGNKKIKYVINPKETMIARGKQTQMKNAFQKWLFQDNFRADKLVEIYNERFNRVVPRKYDGSHLTFDSMNSSWELRPHQRNVVARIIYSGSALMAHEVGAGKTASMIAAGMYMKQAGAVQKPMYVVPNHLTQQFANEFLALYPSANVLRTTKKDFEKKNRHRFISKIATNNYDAVIIGHSQFEKIPLSKERQADFIRKELTSISIQMREAEEKEGRSFTVKRMAGFQKKLRERLETLSNKEKKDDILDFEQLGVDFLFIDEAHVYKNLYTVTKMNNVAGINTSQSQRAMDMFQKVQYIQETNGGKGVVFATGTPISNSMSEMFTMQRFLQNDQLERMGLDTFDSWASTFGEVISSLEMTPEGSGYRMRNRFAKFHNLPELMATFQSVADIQTHDMLNLPKPDLKNGKAEIIVSEISPYQERLMQEFAERAEMIRAGAVQPYEDNMLKVTHEAKLMAIDSRLLDEAAPVDENAKLFKCAENVHRIWEETTAQKSTQIIFSDSGTPKKDVFNVYDEIKHLLIEKGIPADQVAFIHDCNNDQQRETLFEKVRRGEVRVLLGSTGKLGTGTNVQNKLIAGHHIDCPWRPSDLTQRDGRVVRQGNENDEVQLYRYVTKGTFDSYLWQIQEQKLKYISQVMTGKSISRSCDDLDETVLSAAEVKAIATDNPLLAEKMSVDNDITRLQIMRSSWETERLDMQKKIDTILPDAINQNKNQQMNIQEMILLVQNYPLPKKDGKPVFEMEIDGAIYQGRKEVAEMMDEKVSQTDFKEVDQVEIGRYRGLKVTVHKDVQYEKKIVLSSDNYSVHMRYTLEGGTGNTVRISNQLSELPKQLTSLNEQLENMEVNLQMAKQEIHLPFEEDEKLQKLLARQTEINTSLELENLSKPSILEKEEVIER